MFHILSSSLLMSVVLILGLSLRNPKHTRLWYVVFFLFCIGIQLLQALFSMSDFYLTHPHWMHAGTWLLFANGPATWLMIHNHKPSRKVLLLHMLPCLLAFVALLTFYQLNASNKAPSFYGLGPKKMLFWLLFLLHWGGYLIWSIKQKNRSPKWPARLTTIIYLGCGCYLIASLITWLIIVFAGYYSTFWDMTSLLSLALMTAAMTCLFIINPKTATPKTAAKTLPVARLEVAIQHSCKQGIHHQAGLNLHQFATELGFSTRQISDYLNQHLNTHFKQWLNEQRVNDAVQLLLQQPAMDITSIGYQVGFNSHATFYRAFKKATGLSPGDIRKSNQPLKI